jgi:alpha-L-rhamnosidase
VIRPLVNASLTFADGYYDSIRGRIRSCWERDGDRLVLDVEIPANVTAEVHLPTRVGSELRESGQPIDEAEGVEVVRHEDVDTVLRVGSGSYRFEVA